MRLGMRHGRALLRVGSQVGTWMLQHSRRDRGTNLHVARLGGMNVVCKTKLRVTAKWRRS